MATRSGSIDPGLLLHLLASGITSEELGEALKHRSGLLGLTGLAGLREVEQAACAGDDRAQLALRDGAAARCIMTDDEVATASAAAHRARRRS